MERPQITIKRLSFTGAIRKTNISDLVDMACTTRSYYERDQMAELQAQNGHLRDIVGNLLEYLITNGTVKQADLPEMIGNLGDWMIIEDEEGGETK